METTAERPIPAVAQPRGAAPRRTPPPRGGRSRLLHSSLTVLAASLLGRYHLIGGGIGLLLDDDDRGRRKDRRRLMLPTTSIKTPGGTYNLPLFSDPRSVERKKEGAPNAELGAVTDDWAALPPPEAAAAAAVAVESDSDGIEPIIFWINFIDYYEGISHWRVRICSTPLLRFASFLVRAIGRSPLLLE